MKPHLQILKAVVSPLMETVAPRGRTSFNNRMAHLLAQAIKCKICLLIMSDTFWSKEFWTTNSPDLNAVHYYVWGIIESVSNKPRHPIGQPFRLVLMQH